jgi:putative signal transducing protein
MSDRLATVATFRSPVEANLARNRLEAAGIEAFLADEETVGMVWHLTNALGGIKLQVGDRDVGEALAILAESEALELPAAGQADEALPPTSGEKQPWELGRVEVDEPEVALTSREQNADRALRGTVLGLLLLPLQLYAFWLLLKVFVSDERLSPDKRRRAVVAAIINLPLMFGFCLWLKAMLSA